MKRAVVTIWLALLLASAAGWAEKKQYSDLSFVVVREASGKPVRAASVVLHPVDDKGRQKSSGLQLKTDGDGKAWFSGAPYGKLRIQVIAPGLQTFGEDVVISQPTHEFTIKMAPPKPQVTIYK